MTRDELKQIYYLDQELKMWRKELDGIQTQLTETNEIHPAIKDIEFVIEDMLGEIQIQKKKIIDFIMQIEDSLIRQAMFYRHVSLMDWNEVAQKIGGGNTGDGIRKMHDRFME